MAVARGRAAISRYQVCVNLASRSAAAPLRAALVEQLGLGGAAVEVGEAGAGAEAGVVGVRAGPPEGRAVLAKEGRVVLAGGKASRRRRCT